MSNTTSTAQAYEWVKTGHWSLRQFREWFDALAKQEQGEPVAWQWLTTAHFRKKLPKDAEKGAWNPLYTTPQQRKPLTDEQIGQIFRNLPANTPFSSAFDFARAIEAAHGIHPSDFKEKNT